MDEVFLHTLIVSHTHNLNDGGFSHITAIMKEAECLCSPLQMEALLRQKLPEQYKPLVFEKLEIIHDFAEAVKPYLNPNIKFFNIAQYYRFYRPYDTFCAMAYMMLRKVGKFSPPESNESEDTKHGEIGYREAKIKANSFSLVGGREFFYRYLGLDCGEGMMSSIGTNIEMFRKVLTFEANAAPELFKELINGLCEEAQDSIDYLMLDDTPETQKEIQELLQETDLKKGSGAGYIVWLKPPKPELGLPPPLHLHQLVKPIVPSEEVIAKVEKSKLSEANPVQPSESVTTGDGVKKRDLALEGVKTVPTPPVEIKKK
jgi:hypothetical protein